MHSASVHSRFKRAIVCDVPSPAVFAAVAVVQEGTARFFGLKETSATVYQPVPPTIPHVVRVAGAESGAPSATSSAV